MAKLLGVLRSRRSGRSGSTSEVRGDRPIPWLVPTLGMVLVVAFSGLVVFEGWSWLDRYAAAQSANFGAKDFVTAKLDVLKIALSLVAGGGALYVLYVTIRRQRTAEEDLRIRRDSHDHTKRDADERRLTELYSKSLEQLGSEKAAVRMGGLYALERLAEDHEKQRQTVVNVLCAYLRMPYNPPNCEKMDGLEENDAERDENVRAEERQRYELRQQEHEVRLAARRILASHLRPMETANEGDKPVAVSYWPGRLHVDLTGATLVEADFEGCLFTDAVFDRVHFVGPANFLGTTFSGSARFKGARFSGQANFCSARFLAEAVFNSATFLDGARYEEGELSNADFRLAVLKRPSFDPADELRASFPGMKVISTAGEMSFTGVAFSGAMASFQGAVFDRAVYFMNADFRCNMDFDAVRFNEGAAFFTRFGAESRFRNAVFAEMMIFQVKKDSRGVNLSDAWVSNEISQSDLSLPTEWGVSPKVIEHPRLTGSWSKTVYLDGINPYID